MSIQSIIGNSISSVGHSVSGSLSELSTKINNAIGTASASISSLYNGGFVGLDTSNITTLTNDVESYVQRLIAIADNFAKSNDISSSLKGDAAGAAQDYISSIATLLDAYCTTYRNFNTMANNAASSFTESDADNASNISQEAQNILIEAQSIAVDNDPISSVIVGTVAGKVITANDCVFKSDLAKDETVPNTSNMVNDGISDSSSGVGTGTSSNEGSTGDTTSSGILSGSVGTPTTTEETTTPSSSNETSSSEETTTTSEETSSNDNVEQSSSSNTENNQNNEQLETNDDVKTQTEEVSEDSAVAQNEEVSIDPAVAQNEEVSIDPAVAQNEEVTDTVPETTEQVEVVDEETPNTETIATEEVSTKESVSSSTPITEESSSSTTDDRSIEELRDYFGLKDNEYIDNKFAYYKEDLTNTQTEVLSKLDQFSKENNISTEDMKDWAWIMCRESGLKPDAVSSSGTYTGLGQMSPDAIKTYAPSGDYATNIDTQISAGYAYIMDTYGSIGAAKEHWEQHDWY